MSKLKSCPFCGSERLLEGQPIVMGDGKSWRQVECLECHARGPAAVCARLHDSFEANVVWNKRVWTVYPKESVGQKIDADKLISELTDMHRRMAPRVKTVMGCQ